ncbi:MAG: aminotransferase class IV [Candidatus Altiarchaeota archaeon]
MKCWVNEELVDEDDVCISPNDYGFLYGYSVFETVRSYDGKFFRLDEHLARLQAGVDLLGLKDIPSLDQVETIFNSLLSENDLKDGIIRLTLTYGSPPRLTFPKGQKNNLVVTIHPLSPDIGKKCDEGIKVRIEKTWRRDSQSPLGRIKSGNYLPLMMAKRMAVEEGFDDALILNEKGSVCEATTSNLFIVSQGKLFTPSKDQGIVEGITRGAVIEIANERCIPLNEGSVSEKDVLMADEVFSTNSVSELIPVVRVDTKSIGSGSPGKITRDLQSGFRKLIIKELGV